MAGIYDYPGAHPVDRVLAVSRALGFLALAAELLDVCKEQAIVSRGDYEGLATLLRTCVITLDEVAERQQQ